MLGLEIQGLAVAIKDITRKYVIPIFAYLPSIGLIQKPHRFREQGVSVKLPVKNEVNWIELSILSIIDFADEIVIVDSSTDDTTDIIQRMADRYDKIRWFYLPEERFVKACNLMLESTHYRWLIRWEGDFVARTTGEFSIMRLRERIMNLDKDKYYTISLRALNLRGDLFHQPKNLPLSIQRRLHTWSPELKYIQKGRFEQIVGSNIWGKRAPLYYKRMTFNDVYVFHCDVKPARRMLFRRFWTDWMELNDYTHFPQLEDYVKYRIKREWNVDNLEEAEKINMRELYSKLVPYDEEKFGDYPELLKSRLKNPKYKLIYKNGKIIGRNDPAE